MVYKEVPLKEILISEVITLHGAAAVDTNLGQAKKEIPTLEKIAILDAKKSPVWSTLDAKKSPVFAVVLDENSSTNDCLEKLWKSRDPLEDTIAEIQPDFGREENLTTKVLWIRQRSCEEIYSIISNCFRD